MRSNEKNMQIEIKKKTFENMQNRLDYSNPKKSNEQIFKHLPVCQQKCKISKHQNQKAEIKWNQNQLRSFANLKMLKVIATQTYSKKNVKNFCKQQHQKTNINSILLNQMP